MKPIELIKKLKKLGWELDRIHGSHHILKKDNETICIPVHNTDMKPGLLNNIFIKFCLLCNTKPYFAKHKILNCNLKDFTCEVFFIVKDGAEIAPNFSNIY